MHVVLGNKGNLLLEPTKKANAKFSMFMSPYQQSMYHLNILLAGNARGLEAALNRVPRSPATPGVSELGGGSSRGGEAGDAEPDQAPPGR